jgi:hypothetical protein
MAPPPSLSDLEVAAAEVDVCTAADVDEVDEEEVVDEDGAEVADEVGAAVDWVELLKPPGSRSAVKHVNIGSAGADRSSRSSKVRSLESGSGSETRVLTIESTIWTWLC